MDPVTVQIIVGIAIAILVIGTIAWFLMSRRKSHHVGASRHGAETRRQPTMSEVESLRERNELLSSTADRHDRSFAELRDQFERYRMENDNRLKQIELLERTQKELQEQIYELREEHKVLLQRDDRQERVMHDLEARVIGGDHHHTDGLRNR